MGLPECDLLVGIRRWLDGVTQNLSHRERARRGTILDAMRVRTATAHRPAQILGPPPAEVPSQVVVCKLDSRWRAISWTSRGFESWSRITAGVRTPRTKRAPMRSHDRPYLIDSPARTPTVATSSSCIWSTTGSSKAWG